MQRAAGDSRPLSFPWTDAKVSTLRKMWATCNFSATQIACALGFGTEGRNAVIGKIHRLGLSRKTRTQILAALVKNAQATHGKRRAKSELQRAKSAQAIAERQARAALTVAERREKQAAAGRAAIAKVELRLNIGTIKAFFAGHGRAEKSDMMAVARRYGWAPRNDHEADALGIWASAVHHYCPAHATRFRMGPMGAKPRATAPALFGERAEAT